MTSCSRNVTVEAFAAIRGGKLESAEILLQMLQEYKGTERAYAVLKSLLFLRKRDPLSALHWMTEVDPALFPEVRVLCLHELGDPSWEGQARALLDSPNPFVRKAMQTLFYYPGADEDGNGEGM